MTGYPHSSRVMSSGSSSAHTPWPLQATGFTRTRGLVSAWSSPVRLGLAPARSPAGTGRGASPCTGRARARRSPARRPSARWRRTCTVPSGWWHAPRPVTRPAQRRRFARAWPAGRGCASSASAVAMAGSPLKHGPHWPADSRARERATLAVSASPQCAAGSATRTPAPAIAPAGRRSALHRASRRASVRAQPAAVVTAGQHGLHVVAEPQQPAQRRAKRGLGDAHLAVGLANGAQHRAWLSPGADAAEPACAVPRDQRQVRQRLDVLHQRRPPADAALEGAVLLVRGPGGAAVDPATPARSPRRPGTAAVPR